LREEISKWNEVKVMATTSKEEKVEILDWLAIGT
jgi:hypothetical protein